MCISSSIRRLKKSQAKGREDKRQYKDVNGLAALIRMGKGPSAQECTKGDTG